jgi:hypothetical protein
MCDIAGLDQRPMSELIALIPEDTTDANVDFEMWIYATDEFETNVLKALRDATKNCPACMLSALRQSKVSLVHFEYEKEVNRFWAENQYDNSCSVMW